MSRVIVFGANGMAGHVISSRLKKSHNVTNIARKNSDINIDVRNYTELNSFFHSIQSECDYVINSIGMLVKDSENNPSDAIQVNAWFPHFLEERLRKRPTKLIHISTDCVFSGKCGSYKETDITDGEGMYAKTKSIGEIINNKDITVRTSIVGPEIKNGTGLFHWFMNQTNCINGYTNAFWGGVTTIELSKYIEWILSKDLTGLCHLTNNNRISKYDLLMLFKRHTGKNININPVINHMSVDKSIINTRKENDYQVPSYEDMVASMVEYIKKHESDYNYIV